MTTIQDDLKALCVDAGKQSGPSQDIDRRFNDLVLKVAGDAPDASRTFSNIAAHVFAKYPGIRMESGKDSLGDEGSPLGPYAALVYDGHEIRANAATAPLANIIILARLESLRAS